jgi:hypothetical protein
VVGKERLPVPARFADRSPKDLQRRIDAVPDWIRPAFSEFRDHIRDEAQEYQETNPRPTPKTLRRFLAGFVRRIGDPLELAQQGAVAAGYYLPLPDRFNRWTAGLPSAGSAIVGETVLWGSAFTATAGGLTVATVSELLDLYSITSARTQRYRWAQLAPGPTVVRADVITILEVTGQGSAKRSLRQFGLDAIGELAAFAAEGIIGDLAVPAYGAYKGGRRTRAALKRALEEPLSPVPEEGPPPEPDLSASPPGSFYDWFHRERAQGQALLLPGRPDPT